MFSILEYLHELNTIDDTKQLAEVFEIHSDLNPQLFDENDNLYSDIRIRLVEIADMFVASVQEDNIPIKVLDYWLVGSNAQYNYSSTSDIDVHIIVDTEVDNSNVAPYLLQLLYDYVKSSFNDKYDIQVKGHEVELYLEDVKSSAVTNGIYSLKKDEWIKKPQKLEPRSYDVTTTQIWKDAYNKYQQLKDDECEEFLDSLYVMRKISLSQDGEWGDGNLVFKEFRNRGYIQDLKDRKYKVKSTELTLESLLENGPSGQTTAKTLLFNTVGGLQDPAKYGLHHLNNKHTDHVADNIILIGVGKHRSLHAKFKNKKKQEAVELLQQAYYISELRVLPIDKNRAEQLYELHKNSY